MLVDFWGWQFGVHTNPKELNAWLRANNGYIGLHANPWKVAEYGRQLTSANFAFRGRKHYAAQRLRDLLQSNHPVLLAVEGHSVAATGETTFDGGTRTWYLNDPGGLHADQYTFPLTTLQSRYRNQASRMEWGSVVAGPADLASLSLALASPAELLVMDPAGRRTGFDPRTGTAYDEIPTGYYGVQRLIDDNGDEAAPLKVFDLPLSGDGSYYVQVIGAGTGPYALEALAYDASGAPASAEASGEIEPDMVQAYRLDYASVPGSGIELVSVAAIVIEKETKPKGGTGFGFTQDIDTSGDFFLAGGQNRTFLDVPPAQYTVIEHDPALDPGDYDLIRLECVDSEEEGVASSGHRDSRTATIHLDPAETVICTFTNTGPGKIIVEKVTEPAGDPAIFSYSGDLEASLRDGERDGRSVPRGTYTVQETSPPGWALADISCTDSDSGGDLETATATYQINAGEKVLCTFTSSRMGTITLQKQTKPPGLDQAFSFAGAIESQLKDGETATVQVAPGSHSVWEMKPAGWHVDSIRCDDDDSLSDSGIGIVTFKVESGEHVTCTFTNRQDQPDFELYLPVVVRNLE
jgi:hypothetical protein